MPKTNTPAFTQSIKTTGTIFFPADTTTTKTICTAGTNDSRVTRITITSTDTAANVAYFYINDGTTNFLIGYVVIVANAGSNGSTPSVAGLSASSWLHRSLDNNANPYFELQTGYTLRMSLQNAVSATREIDVIVSSEDY
jgi:hypothetical protein